MSTSTTSTPDTALASTAEVPLRELAPAELGAWRGLLRVHSALVKALDAELLATHGLPLTSYEVLINLQAAPGRRLERDTCDSDGRGCFAVLTDRGEQLLTKARATHLEGVRERFLRHFEPGEHAQMAEWWNRALPGAGDVADLSLSD